VPRRYAVQPAGTAGYSLAGSIFVMVFALGFLVLLYELLQLGLVAWDRHRYRLVEHRSSWTGGTYLARERREPVVEPEEPLPQVREPSGRALATSFQLGTMVAVAVVCVFSFLPAVADASEGNTGYHHLLHASEFLLGAAVGLILASLQGVHSRLDSRAVDLGLAAAILAPVLMMLSMLPAVYELLDHRPALHFLYHVGIAALGVLTGLGAGALGRVTGRIAFVLAVGMAVIFAAGAGGG
jgi:hypothetical protein